MPSDTAFLFDMPAGTALAGSYDSLGSSADALGGTRHPSVSSSGISPRELSSAIQNLRALGINIDENNAILKGLRVGILTNYSLYMLYRAVAAARKAEAAKETALAVGETAALAVAQQWHRIAQGAAAAAMVAIAFSVGEKFGSGDWNLPSVDMTNPADRRDAARQLSEVTNR